MSGGTMPPREGRPDEVVARLSPGSVTVGGVDISVHVAHVTVTTPADEAARRAQREKLAAGAEVTRSRSRRLDACRWGYCAHCDRDVPLKRGRLVVHETYRPPPDTTAYHGDGWRGWGQVRYTCADSGKRPSAPPPQRLCWALGALMRRRAADGA